MKTIQTTIIVVTRNRLHLTVACLAAVLRTIPGQTEVLVIDNHSSDGTQAFVRDLCAREPRMAEPIFLDRYIGWCAAVNLGLKQAAGEYLVILSSDVVCGPGWLDGLITCMRRTPAVMQDIKKVGLVGPVTNTARNQKQVVEAHYHPEILEDYIRRHQAQFHRNWITALFLSGFCLLVHRRCYEEIGDLDSTFDRDGFFENDWALRAQEKGWHCIIAGDVFVHRAVGSGVDSSRNGSGQGSDDPAAFFSKWRAHNTGPKRLVAVYRVKNCEETIARSLDATARFADHIVVLDDGSDDGTSRICRDHPAVSHYEFQELPFDERRDRNRIIALAARFQPDWVISIDSDEVFEMSRERAQQLMALNDPQIGALGFHWYTFWEPTHTYFRFDGAFGVTNGFRMFKWAPDQRIVLGTPEGLHCGNIPQFPDGAHSYTNVRVRHLSYDTEARRQAKYRFYREVDKNPQEILVGSKNYTHLISPTVTLRRYSPEHGLSLCLITKNEEARLENFLSYFQAFVDEMCVVDTGSSDRSMEIARQFTDKVERFPMPGLELDQARNRCLAMAAQPWILSLDPDEEIDFWDFPKLQRLTDDLEAHAYTFEVVNYQKEGAPVMTQNIRLFRNDRRIYYTHPVHETVEQSLKAFDEAVIRPAGFPLHHFGFLKEDDQIQRKLDLYLARNKAYREDNPQDPLGWYNEALHYLNEGNYREAVYFLNQAISLDPGFTAPYGQLAYIDQEHAIFLWQSLLQRMAADHPGRPQAQQALDNLKSLTPPRRIVGEARRRQLGRDRADVFPE